MGNRRAATAKPKPGATVNESEPSPLGLPSPSVGVSSTLPIAWAEELAREAIRTARQRLFTGSLSVLRSRRVNAIRHPYPSSISRCGKKEHRGANPRDSPGAPGRFLTRTRGPHVLCRELGGEIR